MKKIGVEVSMEKSSCMAYYLEITSTESYPAVQNPGGPAVLGARVALSPTDTQVGTG